MIFCFPGNSGRFFKIIIFSMALLPFLQATAQDEDVAGIKKEYAEIRNHLSDFRVEKKELSGESAEGGTLTAYYDDTIVRLIVEEFFGETGKRVTEYYFSNLSLFFVLDVTCTYNRPIYMDSAYAVSAGDNEWYDHRKTRKSEERFYFKNQSLFRWLDKNSKPMNLKSGPSATKEKEWVEHSARVLSVFINTEQ